MKHEEWSQHFSTHPIMLKNCYHKCLKIPKKDMLDKAKASDVQEV